MLKRKTFVIGHRNPDTDSICSAIAYAELKKLIGFPEVVAARSGDVNNQTKFALEYFKVKPPMLVSDITPRVKDCLTADVVSMPLETPIKILIDTMDTENIRLMPLTTEGNVYQGLVSLFDVTLGFKKLANPQTCLKLHTSVKNMQTTLGAEAIHMERSEECFDGIVLVGAMECDDFVKWFDRINSELCIILTGNRPQIQKAALEQDIHCLIVSGGQKISPEISKLAIERGVSLLISPYDTATTLGMVHLSAPARTLLPVSEDGFSEKQIISENQLISEAKEAILDSHNRGMVVVDENKAVKGIVTSADILNAYPTSIIMVDHNESSQAVTGIEFAEIVEIIDHHRLGNAHTNSPICFINEPVGSTCTIVARCYFTEGVEMSPQVAGLLMSGIISDTLFFKSPTATETDRRTIERLNLIAKLDLPDYAAKLLEAGARLEGRSAEKIITEDFKEYEVKKGKFGIGQVEVIGFGGIQAKVAEIKTALKKVRTEHKLDFVGVLVTDITYSNSQLFFEGSEAFCVKLDYPMLGEKVAELKGIVSRKKQVVPHLLNVFK